MAGFGLGFSVPVQNTKEELIELYFPGFPGDIMIGEKSIKDFALEIHSDLESDSGIWLPEAVALPLPPGEAGAGGAQALPPPPPKAAACGSKTFSCEMNFGNDGNFQCYKKVNPSEIVVGDYSEAVKIETLLLENKDGNFSKEYAFFDIDNNYTYLSILNEIVTHCYALYLLREVCTDSLQNVTIPNIIRVSKTSNGRGDAKIKIEMEYVPNLVNAPSLLTDEKNAILANWKNYVDQIKTLLDCFETNNLFHNDTHIDNLTFSKNGDSFKLVLIDFGKATFKEQINPSTTGFSKTDDKAEAEAEAKANFESWLNGKFGHELGGFYGGKKSKTKHRKSKTKHNKTKRKTKSKRKTKRTK